VGERTEIKAESTPGREVFQDLSQALDTLMDPPLACQVPCHLDARLQAKLRAAPLPFPSIPAIKTPVTNCPHPNTLTERAHGQLWESCLSTWREENTFSLLPPSTFCQAVCREKSRRDCKEDGLPSRAEERREKSQSQKCPLCTHFPSLSIPQPERLTAVGAMRRTSR